MGTQKAAIHPGEILKQKLADLNISGTQLSLQLRVPASRITAILNGQRSITTETAIRLACFFDEDPKTWLHLQVAYDLDEKQNQIGEQIKKEVLPLIKNSA